MSEHIRFKYVGDYRSSDRGLLKHCFQMISDDKHYRGHTLSLSFLLTDDHYKQYLAPALQSCKLIPKGLSLKEQVAFLQLLET